MLRDKSGRKINYLRLAITDRCNLRCHYCMPAEGLNWLPRASLLSYEEIMRLLGIYHQLGITKLRFTGGEPFLRRDFMRLLESVSAEKWFDHIAITTNGTITARHIPSLKEIGINSVNLSLDTLDPMRFNQITRRDDFDQVMSTLNGLIEHEIPFKINAVIMEGKNEDDISALASFTKNNNVDVRFIEEMPFNGKGATGNLKWNYKAIINQITDSFGELEKLPVENNSTSLNYRITGYLGTVGVIPAWSRTFCGTCNRIRLTPQGIMKTCLYSESGIDLTKMLRDGMSDESIKQEIIHAVKNKEKDGFEAENMRGNHAIHESMSTIGG